MSKGTVALHQVIAVLPDARKRTEEGIEKSRQIFSKPGLMQGIARTYQPKSEDDPDKLPPEATRVQIKASEITNLVSKLLIQLFDEQYTLEIGNCQAKADIIIDGHTIASQVPVTYLLFLEKQLDIIEAFVKRIPLLDSGENWHFDASQDIYATDVVETTRSKKTPRVLVKHEGNQWHAPQVEIIHEDNVVGNWRTIKYSGALSAQLINQVLARIDGLRRAVKVAREEANRLQLPMGHIGENLLNYLFSDLT